MKHFINLKDIPAKDLRRILIDAKKRKSARKKLNNLEIKFISMLDKRVSIISISKALVKIIPTRRKIIFDF